MLKGKHIILGISGGIAAYKAATLLRLLVRNGAEVQVVMTPAGKEFITPVTLSALSGRPVVSEFFTANSGEWHSHVDLGLWADLMVIAPATASTIAKMATGVADNMLITTYLSAKEQVIVAPAMDLDMFAHPSTQRNLTTLKDDGVIVIEPASGELASHLVGKGRMEEPENIFRHICEYFATHEMPEVRPLSGKKVLVTAGPTHEAIDPVRFIGNYSSGKMGFALAEACAAQGADVALVTGPVTLPSPSGHIRRIDVVSAREMLEECKREFEDSDICIFAAAVADYAPAMTSESKIKRENIEEMNLLLVRNPDIAAILGAQKGNRTMVGFALETENGLEHAKNKMIRKNFDWIVLNSLSDPGAGFNTDTNKITLLGPDGFMKIFPLKSKKDVAADIVGALMSSV